MSNAVDHPTARTRRPNWLPLIGAALLAVWLVGLDYPRLGSTLLGAKRSLLGAALLAYLAIYPLKAWRWGLCLDALDIRLPYARLLTLYTATAALGAVTPGRAGELMRWGLLARSGAQPGRAAAGVLLDRLCDVGITIGMAGLLLLGYGSVVHAAGPTGAFRAAAFPALALPKRRVGRGWLDQLTRVLPARVRATLAPAEFAAFGEGLKALRGSRLIGVMALSLGIWLLNAAISYLLLRSVAPSLDPERFALGYALTGVASYLPVTISGMGARETLFITLFAATGLTAEAVVGYGLLELAFMGLVTAAFAGLFALGERCLARGGVR